MEKFGEQLRRAREAKGMTQQALAEKLFVTRQAVSGWECGDRYPDLITTKRISQILEVSIDDLLSENEMKSVAEHNSVIEEPVVSVIVIVLLAFIVFAYLVSAANMLIQNPFKAFSLTDNGFLKIGIEFLSRVIQTVIFAYGLVMAVKGMLSREEQALLHLLPAVW